MQEQQLLEPFNINNFSQEFFLYINGQRYAIEAPEKISPETSLNTYLRNTLNLRDTKVMCREGGCGACVVAATFYNPITKKKKTTAVNSCLVPILACHKWKIETNLGIGNKTKGYHEIQHALAKFGGSQCGFCSSGMVMSMYALSQSKDTLSMKDIENSFGGNLCRCTGYRPILDAFKSLASDADSSMGANIPDIEDIKICPKSKKECSGRCKEVNFEPICWKANGNSFWYKVFTIDDIFNIFQKIGNDSYRLVAGNTGKGLYPITTPQKYWIDIRDVKELTTYSTTENLVLGGGISITDSMETMTKMSEENENFWYLDEVQKHLDLVANVPVRNNGTLGGNLTMKRDHHEFPSDVFLLLTTIGATITIVQSNGIEITTTVPEYVKMNLSKFVLKQINFSPKTKNSYLLKTYKIMQRAQNAIAYVNAGFLVNYEKDYVVKSCNIIFGGINPKFINAQKTENYLVGKKLFENKTIQGALITLTDELQPDEVSSHSSSEFRKNLARNLFYKFILATAPHEKLNPKFLTGGLPLEREVSKGAQLYETKEEIYPITKPVPKIEAMHQTSGEARYIDDMPSMPGELFGAFVLAETVPLSKIKEVDTSEALKMPGVIAYVNHKDVPGKNLFCSPPLLKIEEELFCSGKVLYNGQPVGVILAESFDQAQSAANVVNITYETTDEKPIFKIKDLLKRNDKERIQNIVTKDGVTEKNTSGKYKIKGEANFTGQFHFTMETQNCLGIPNDDGSYTLHPGTQWMDLNQYSAALALNIPMNKINVVVKRVGGAFGGKQIRSSLTSTACAVASHKVQRPVRLVLPLTTNMKAVGKRAPAFAKYEVEADENGKIVALDMSYYQAPGTSGPNEQIIIFMNSFLKNGYNDESWNLSGNTVRTEMAGNCFMRAPANVEAIAIIENIMRHIAKVSGIDELQVRNANFSSECSEASEILRNTLSWAEYDKRRKEVDAFNKRNRWMKKGLGMAMMNFNMAVLCPYSVMLSIFSVDGSVTISHGGIECGQGINTKVIQVCAYQLQIPMNMITIQPTYSFVSPNNQMTGAGVTSEAICYATIQACQEIHRRLEPVKRKMNNPSWKELVRQAHVEEVELRTTYMFTSKSEPPYLIPGACLAEVQVDILTGEYILNRVDLMEDLGVSLNPQVDMGQVEGAFIIGLGHFISEELIYDNQGKLLTNDTWTYKVPGAKDIPVDFRVKFKVDGNNPSGVLNTKACGEPAVCLAVSVPFAIRDALHSARKDADPSDDSFIEIDGPTTVEFTLQNTLNDYKSYNL